MVEKVSIVDYGLGNILSVSRAISSLGIQVDLVETPEQIDSSSFLVLPGVGAFNRGISELKSRALIAPIKKHIDSGKPLLGICLGMQLLFDSSDENECGEGLGAIPGKVVRIVPENSDIKVPHIGWSKMIANNGFEDIPLNGIERYVDNKFVYFVHSYHPNVDPSYLLATINYQGCSINAMVKKKNVVGCQFHPEKSGDSGREILKHIFMGLS